MSSYDDAVTTLYRAAHESFVAERQRLSSELKASGDKPAAAKLGKLSRPPISAWAVNQLWWRSPKLFQALFAAAEELRAGKQSARAAHRHALNQLSSAARKLLAEAGHATSEATLRKVELTLASLAVAGGFEPDAPGALGKDRDPPGFEAFGIGSAEQTTEVSSDEPARPAAHERTKPDVSAREVAEAERKAKADAERAHEAELAEAQLVEKKRLAEAKAQREAELRELEAAWRAAKSEVSARERERDRLAAQLSDAQSELERANVAARAAEQRLRATETE